MKNPLLGVALLALLTMSCQGNDDEPDARSGGSISSGWTASSGDDQSGTARGGGGGSSADVGSSGGGGPSSGGSGGGSSTGGSGGGGPSSGGSGAGSSIHEEAGPASGGGAASAGCIPDGSSANSDAECCSGQLDLTYLCCSGSNCCSAANHATSNPLGGCMCEPGYEWQTGAAHDRRCIQADHVVNCTSTVTDPKWCSCASADTNPGETEFVGYCEKDPTFAPMACCKSNGYPATGTCDCYLTQAWRCLAFTDVCYCSYYWDADAIEYTTRVCDNVPEPDGTPWRCCLSDYGGCNCRARGAACGAHETEVANCASDAALGFTRFTGCPAGQSSANGCTSDPHTGGGQCTTDSQCGGSCTGDDPVCCPTCKNGYCGQLCCSTSGVCY
ncbi:hypothetical protein [Sorangium sp. So ce381]|uniref:hypothetical protein n=1 Tax=Sorangium sp. So ce381 TaxID=3133307 RepID=UPI003F5C1638